jgi:autophagy-related protein 13
LLFQMSELHVNRRSIEEGRGGSGAGSGERRRGGSPWR